MKAPFIVPAYLAALLVASSPACAWDPDREDLFPDPEPPVPAAAALDLPEGIYLVTDRYVDDVVSHAGPVTVYSTETVHEITGSYARVLETVATGARSDFDGTAFNGRGSLTDGRAVAGTYYENYVRTGDGFVAVSVVFFQDDLETARALRPTGPSTAPVNEPAFAPVAAPAPTAIGSVAPIIADPQPQVLPVKEPDLQERIVVPAPRAAVPDRSLEVLRGRRIAISFPDPGLTRWTFIGGDAVVMGATAAAPTQPFVARWDRLAPVGGVWVTRFALAFTDGTTRDLVVRVAVRAPGLVE